MSHFQRQIASQAQKLHGGGCPAPALHGGRPPGHAAGHAQVAGMEARRYRIGVRFTQPNVQISAVSILKN